MLSRPYDAHAANALPGHSSDILPNHTTNLRT
jgi:hypothetical protein